MCLNRGVEGGRQDAFIFSEQGVREPMEVADAADHGGPSDDDLARTDGVSEKSGVLDVAYDQSIARMIVERMANWPVLAEVVNTGHLVSGLQELLDEVAADEARGTCKQDVHAPYSLIPLPSTPHTSTTSLPFVARLRYASWGAPKIRMSEFRTTVSRGSSCGS